MLDRQGQFIAGHWAAGEEAPEETITRDMLNAAIGN